MIFKCPRKFVRLDLKSTFPVLENSGSVREGFKNLFLEFACKGGTPCTPYGTNSFTKKVCRVGGYPLPPLRTDAKRRFSEPSLGRLESQILMNFQKISKVGGGRSFTIQKNCCVFMVILRGGKQ